MSDWHELQDEAMWDEAHKEWEDEREAVGMRALRAHLGCDPSQAAAEAVTSLAKAGPDFEGSWQDLTADKRKTATDHARTLNECGAFESVLAAFGREGARLARAHEEPEDHVVPDDYAGTQALMDQALMEVARDHARAVRVRSLCPSRRLDRRLSGGRPPRRRATRATASSSRGDPDPGEPPPALAGPSPRFSRPWRPKADRQLAEALKRLEGLAP
jgi:hypothetical protein